MSEGCQPSGLVSVDGASLHYIIEGSGIPALVIGSAVYYPRTFSSRLREAFRLAFIDVRHFAESDPSFDLDRISLDTYTDDIEKVRTQTGFEPAVVIGHSHHGNLALEYAKRHPAKVSHVVLIGSPPLEESRTAEAAKAYWENHASETRKAALREKLAALGAEVRQGLAPENAYIARYLAEGPKYWYDAAYDASFLWRGVPVNMDIIKVFRGFFANNYELGWDPERLRAPVLVVMGRYDYVVPHILWAEVRPKLRNLTFHLFEHSGHTPQLEEPERLDRVLLKWIQRESAAGAI